MAVAVQQCAFGDRLERELKRARLRLARQEFLEQECVRGQATALFALHERRDLVAKAEHAARLEPDEGNSAPEEGRERSGATLSLAPRLIDEAHCEKGTPAAERSAAISRLGEMHPISGGGEHGEGSLDILRLEVAVESIRKEHDRPRLWAGNARRLAPSIAAPARQTAPGAQARVSLRPLPQARDIVAHVGEPGPLGRERRITRQMADEALVQREPALCNARRLHLDL